MQNVFAVHRRAAIRNPRPERPSNLRTLPHNADFKNCGAAATTTLSPLGLSPPVGTQPAAIRRPQPSGRSPVNPHTVGVSKDISTNPRLIHLPGLPDYMTREAKRPGEGSFQFPRCTIHGSGEERLKTFMNFSSPARRKLHKNS